MTPSYSGGTHMDAGSSHDDGPISGPYSLSSFFYQPTMQRLATACYCRDKSADNCRESGVGKSWHGNLPPATYAHAGLGAP